MVPLCYMLFLYVCGLKQYGQVSNSCQLCFLICSVLKFKIENRYKQMLLLFSVRVAE